MSPIYPHEEMPLAELCEALHKQGATWFNNRDLLLLEELIRRAKKSGAPHGDDHDRRHQPVRDVPASAGADVRPAIVTRYSYDDGPKGRALTQEEIAQIESHGRDAWADILG